MTNTDSFMTAFRGLFSSTLHWEDFDRLWALLEKTADDAWYVYAVGEPVPQTPASRDQFVIFLQEISVLLRHNHLERYCGIVYADNLEQPAMIKIYDPDNLGSSCGSGNHPPPLPGWILSRQTPESLEDATQPTANRRRWWQKIFAAG